MERIGARIRLAREVVGVGQRPVADACGKSIEWLRRVEGDRPGAVVTERHVRDLADFLGVSPQWLLCLSNEGGPVKRREFVRLGAALAAEALVPGPALASPEPWEALEAVLGLRCSVDRGTVAALANITTSLEALQYSVTPPGMLMRQITAHLETLTTLLREGNPDGLARANLLSLAGETAGAAAWLEWDVSSPAAARYWSLARRAAAEGGDQALAAFIDASTSWLPQHRDGPPDRRQRMLADAEPGATARTLVWNLMAQAECLAQLGDERCLALVDRAHSVFSGIGDDRDVRRPRCDSYDEARWLGDTGAVMVRLAASGDTHRPRALEACALLERAISGMDAHPEQLRMQASLRVNHARALARGIGDPDGAVEAALRALHDAQALGVTTIQARLRDPSKLLADLNPWREHQAVRLLRDRLAA